MNADGRGSSMRVKRVLLMTEPPQVDGHEITDKGYINQRATLDRRKALVETLCRRRGCHRDRLIFWEENMPIATKYLFIVSMDVSTPTRKRCSTRSMTPSTCPSC